jgi:hypothetical protein
MKIEKRHREKLKELKQFFVFYGHCFVPKNESFIDLYEWTERLRQSRHQLSDALTKELESLGFHWGMYSTRELLWQFRYNELKAFKKKHGHTKVTMGDDHELGRWVNGQRGAEKRMGPERKKLLDELGFLWRADLKKLAEEKWNNHYKALKEFKKKNGHTAVPNTRHKNNDLGVWVGVQREFEHKMSAARKELLDAIGFLWKKDLPAFREKQWDEWYYKLLDFKEKEGHVSPRAHAKSESELGTWVQRQRKANKRGKLSDSKLNKLKAIGFEWTLDIQKKEFQKWLNFYEELKTYKAIYGTCKIPRPRNINDIDPKKIALGNWVQRQRYRPQRLSKKQLDLLNDIGFEWKKDIEIEKTKDWEKRYNQLVEFFKENGHSKVPATYESNKALGNWVYYQRKNEIKLTAIQRAKLNKVNFYWRADLEKEIREFDERIKELQLFYKKYKHICISQNAEEYSNLRIWLEHIKKGAIKPNQEQKKQLTEMGFEWNEDLSTKKRTQWMKQFRKLEAFKEKHGHTKVTRSSGDHSLYGWVQTQRNARYKMPQWRREHLDEIGFLWDAKQIAAVFWQKRYDELVAFKEEYGHTRVSERWSDRRLGAWVGKMRHTKDKLNSDQVEKLNAIDFDWSI